MRWLVSALIFLMGVGAICSQLYPSPLGIVGSKAFHLGEPRVQFELKIDSEQAKQIAELLAEHNKAQVSISNQLGSAKPDQYGALQAKLAERERSCAKNLQGLLDAAQLKRFKQIAMQSEGPFALRNIELAKQLSLAAEQRVKIETIAQTTLKTLDDLSAKMGTEIEAAPPGKKGDKKRQEIVRSYEPKMNTAERSGEAQILAVLTSKQKADWKKSLGAPFKL